MGIKNEVKDIYEEGLFGKMLSPTTSTKKNNKEKREEVNVISTSNKTKIVNNIKDKEREFSNNSFEIVGYEGNSIKEDFDIKTEEKNTKEKKIKNTKKIIKKLSINSEINTPNENNRISLEKKVKKDVNEKSPTPLTEIRKRGISENREVKKYESLDEMKNEIIDNNEKELLEDERKKISEKERNKQNLLNEIKEKGKSDAGELIEDKEALKFFKRNEKLSNLLLPKTVKETEDGEYLIINEKVYIKYLSIESDSPVLPTDLLIKLDANNDIGEFSVHSIFQPIDRIKSKEAMDKKKKSLRQSILFQNKQRGGGMVDQELFEAEMEVSDIIGGLTRTEIKMYKFYNIIRLHDTNLERLKKRIGFVKSLVSVMSFELILMKHLQLKVHGMFGIGGSSANFYDLSVNERLPYIYTADYSIGQLDNVLFKEDKDVDGIPLGEDLLSKRFVVRNLRGVDNYNVSISATSGSGKSYAVKTIATREYNEGNKILIVDPENEYERLCKQLGGEYIDLGTVMGSGGVKINPFDFVLPREMIISKGVDYIKKNKVTVFEKIDTSFKNHKGYLKEIIRMILGFENVNTENNKKISPLLSEFFEETGKLDTNNMNSFFKLSMNPVSIRDFYLFLGKKIEKMKSLNLDYAEIQSIYEGLYDYGNKEGSNSYLFSEGKTNFSLKEDFIVFNLKGVDDVNRKSLMVFIIMQYIQDIFSQKHEQRVRIIIDEIHVFMEANIIIAEFLSGLIARARKYNIGVTVVGQAISTFYKFGKTIGDKVLNNLEAKLFMAQEKAGLDAILKYAGLSTKEYEFINNLSLDKAKKINVKGHGLFKSGSSVDRIKIIAEGFLHKYITTDPEELSKIYKEEEKAKRKNNK